MSSPREHGLMGEGLTPRRQPSVSFDVAEREYTHDPTIKKNADQLKYSWETAPKGRVFFLSRDIARQDTHDTSSVASTPRGQLHDEQQSLLPPPNQGTNYQSKDDPASSHYTPGVASEELDELRATSIAGNDISSSCLYATGIVATASGKYAPFASALVCIVLFLFRRIYSEVFSAIPMNGGTYTALLNTSSKNMAALAAVLSTISYTATAVTSAASAGDYLNYEWSSVPSEWVCIGVLIFFALLTLMGIKDSANTATALFLLHISTMGSLVIGALVYVIRDKGVTLTNSWNSDSPLAVPQSNVMKNLFFGYCTALLGVTGFESSSNYIEEQRPGVFPKTLRNMWIVITVINPTLAVLCMGVVPIEELVNNANYSLALVGDKCIGSWFRTLIVVDAALVLSGAVLTGYVGITGMHRRLALDRIMPNFFLDVNSFRKTNHWIIVVFCILTTSLRLLVNDMNVLGGVYAIAFLGVMALFSLSNFFLKFRRGKLPRTPIAHPIIVLIAMLAVLAGMGGNMARDPTNAGWFGFYFAVFGLGVVLTMQRVTVLRLMMRLIPSRYMSARKVLERKIHELRQFPVIFFVKEPNLHVMNKAISYISKSEDTKCIKIVHMESMTRHAPLEESPHSPLTKEPAILVLPPTSSVNPVESDMARGGLPVPGPENTSRNGSINSHTMDVLSAASPQDVRTLAKSQTRQLLEQYCTILDALYPKVTIDIVFVDHEFSPQSVFTLSEQLNIPRNYMFMTCPSNKFNHTIGHLGGVRVIQH